MDRLRALLGAGVLAGVATSKFLVSVGLSSPISSTAFELFLFDALRVRLAGGDIPLGETVMFDGFVLAVYLKNRLIFVFFWGVFWKNEWLAKHLSTLATLDGTKQSFVNTQSIYRTISHSIHISETIQQLHIQNDEC